MPYHNTLPNYNICDTFLTQSEKRKDLDMRANAKLIKLSKKYPQMCAQYLVEMHKIISWAQKELRKI